FSERQARRTSRRLALPGGAVAASGPGRWVARPQPARREGGGGAVPRHLVLPLLRHRPPASRALRRLPAARAGSDGGGDGPRRTSSLASLCRPAGPALPGAGGRRRPPERPDRVREGGAVAHHAHHRTGREGGLPLRRGGGAGDAGAADRRRAEAVSGTLELRRRFVAVRGSAATVLSGA